MSLITYIPEWDQEIKKNLQNIKRQWKRGKTEGNTELLKKHYYTKLSKMK